MSVLGLGLVGVVVGAVGSEFLRATRPDFVKRIEESAKRFVERLSPSEPKEDGSSDEPPAEE